MNRVALLIYKKIHAVDLQRAEERIAGIRHILHRLVLVGQVPETAQRRKEAQDRGVPDVLVLPRLRADAVADVRLLLRIPALRFIRIRAEFTQRIAELVEITDLIHRLSGIGVHVGVGILRHPGVARPVARFLQDSSRRPVWFSPTPAVNTIASTPPIAAV